jgi:hypothetical protein
MQYMLTANSPIKEVSSNAVRHGRLYVFDEGHDTVMVLESGRSGFPLVFKLTGAELTVGSGNSWTRERIAFGVTRGGAIDCANAYVETNAPGTYGSGGGCASCP